MTIRWIKVAAWSLFLAGAPLAHAGDAPRVARAQKQLDPSELPRHLEQLELHVNHLERIHADAVAAKPRGKVALTGLLKGSTEHSEGAAQLVDLIQGGRAHLDDVGANRLDRLRQRFDEVDGHLSRLSARGKVAKVAASHITIGVHGTDSAAKLLQSDRVQQLVSSRRPLEFTLGWNTNDRYGDELTTQVLRYDGRNWSVFEAKVAASDWLFRDAPPVVNGEPKKISANEAEQQLLRLGRPRWQGQVAEYVDRGGEPHVVAGREEMAMFRPTEATRKLSPAEQLRQHPQVKKLATPSHPLEVQIGGRRDFDTITFETLRFDGNAFYRVDSIVKTGDWHVRERPPVRDHQVFEVSDRDANHMLDQAGVAHWQWQTGIFLAERGGKK